MQREDVRGAAGPEEETRRLMDVVEEDNAEV